MRPTPDDDDEAYEIRVQREIDERWEEQLMAAKRNAAGASPEEVTLLDAYVQGRRAGRDFSSPEMNPHPAGSAKAFAWEKGRISMLGQIARRAA